MYKLLMKIELSLFRVIASANWGWNTWACSALHTNKPIYNSRLTLWGSHKIAVWKVSIFIQISQTFVARSSIDNKSALVYIMVCSSYLSHWWPVVLSHEMKTLSCDMVSCETPCRTVAIKVKMGVVVILVGINPWFHETKWFNVDTSMDK